MNNNNSLMNRNWSYLPLFLIPIIDQILKSQSKYVLNQNYMLGLFHDVPLYYKSVFLISIFLIIFAIYLFVLILLNPQVIWLRISASGYLAGMFSNCIDKMLFLGVRDHIAIGNNIVCNFADIAQWITLPILIFSLFYYSKDLWDENCLRKSFFKGSNSQIKIATNFFIIIFINILFIGFFCFSFLNYLNLGPTVFWQFLKLFSLFSVGILISSMVFLVIYSQRIVGPFVSFIAFIKEKKYLNNQKFKIRKGDPLVEIEDIADLIIKDRT